MTPNELCEALHVPLEEWASGCPAPQLWLRCPEPTWLLRVAAQLNLCDNRTFVQLAYDFALRVHNPTDSPAREALDLVKRLLDGTHVPEPEFSFNSLAHSVTSSRAAARAAAWASQTWVHSIPAVVVWTIDAATAATAATLRSPERAWQCDHIRALISAPKLPDDLIVAVAAERLREAL